MRQIIRMWFVDHSATRRAYPDAQLASGGNPPGTPAACKHASWGHSDYPHGVTVPCVGLEFKHRLTDKSFMSAIFTPGEYEAARMYIAILTKHCNQDGFNPEEIGFIFGEDRPVALSPDEVLITTKDFIRAGLKIMEGQLDNLSKTLGIEIPELVSHLGLAVAKENPEDA